MQLTVLVDNNTLIDRYFLAEPGLALYIEIDDRKILFDTGYSDIFLRNAHKMGIDWRAIDTVVLSHGHLDHTWGLQHLIQAYVEQALEGRAIERPTLVAHPHVFDRRFIPGGVDIGCLASQETVAQYFDLQLTSQPYWLHPDLVFLGEIQRANHFESQHSIGRAIQNGRTVDDFLPDDTALAYRSPQGLVIIAGCSHAGICNTVAQAMTICNESRLVDIIGGFHLLDAPDAQLLPTVEQIAAWRPSALHACHCTDFKARMALSQVAAQQEVGVGLKLTF